MAELFAEGLQSLPDAKIQAVAGRTADGSQRFAAQFTIAKALADFDQLLQDGDVDVIYISTPNEQHSYQCKMALKAGKAVLCEKPFGLNAAQAQEVVDLARERNLFCMEAMWMRFAPAVRDALQLAREGKLGELQFFSGQLGFPYTPDPDSRLFRQPGGGALLDLGVYPLSLAQALFGNPVQVSSQAQLNPVGVDEQFAAVLSYSTGTQAIIAASLRAKLSNSASLHGRTSVLQLDEPLYFPESYKLVNTPAHSAKPQGSRRLSKLRRYPILRTLADLRNKANATTVNKRSSQNGYSFEASEVHRCLAAGLIESPEMPWKDTVAVLRSMDSIRACWQSASGEKGFRV